MLTRNGEKHLVWIDLVAPTPAEVRSLMHEFDLHPLVAQELLAPSAKSKVERHQDAIFLILHFPAPKGSARSEQEIDFIIGRNFLITARYDTYNPLHSFSKAFEVDTVLERTGAREHGGHLFIAMTRNLYQSLLAETGVLQSRLQDIEARIFSGNEREMVVELSLLGRTIHDFRQALTPHQEMLSSFEPQAARLFGPEFSYYVRALYGEHESIVRTITHLREGLRELRETNNSLVSTKQNEIMTVLTIMAFVTFPLALISSIFGMNTDYLPIVGMPGDFWIVTGFMVFLAIIFFIYFKHKKWL